MGEDFDYEDLEGIEDEEEEDDEEENVMLFYQIFDVKRDYDELEEEGEWEE